MTQADDAMVAFACFIATIAIVAGSAVAQFRPDPIRTPGAINPNVIQANISETICRKNWTSTIRPSSSFTNKIKVQQMKAWGFTGNPGDYEEDHLISLELGGAARDPRNLWPQSWKAPGAREKDVVESYLHRQVCKGSMTLAEAQDLIRGDWYTIYLKIHKVKK